MPKEDEEAKGFDARVDYDAMVERLEEKQQRIQADIEKNKKDLARARRKRSDARRRFDTHVKVQLGGLLMKAYGLTAETVCMDAFAQALVDEKANPPRLPRRESASVPELPVREAAQRMASWEKSHTSMAEWGRTACPECGASVDPQAEKCWNCRKAITPVANEAAGGTAAHERRCPECGSQVAYHAPTCPECGRAINWRPAGAGAPEGL